MTTESQNTPDNTENPGVEKLADVKAVIAYLAETFPQCFSLEGDAKPLKIGLFQELAERLAEDPKVSKTQLRQALRRYTNSWRYLRCQVEGAKRVDLDGNEVAELEAEHIEHAQTALKESQDKARAARAEKQAQTRKDGKGRRGGERGDRAERGERKPRNPRADKVKAAKLKSKPETVRNSQPLRTVSSGELKVDQAVMVQLGRAPAKGVVVDINKDDVMVRLDSGLTVKVKAEHIRI